MSNDKTYKTRGIVLGISLVILLLPVIVYSYQFGIGMWTSHSEWAEMGSALGGIYSPILTVLMVLLLFKQTNIQSDMAKQTYDTYRISQSKERLDYHKINILKVLSIKGNDGFLMSLNKVRQACNDISVLTKIDDWFDSHLNQLSVDWVNIQGILAGLNQPEESEYILHFSIIKSMLISELSHEVCTGLDNICYNKEMHQNKDFYFFMK
ncbi:hypothetical protein [Colwellia sp. TT2012]|uniref:hypothetical protein n=1 Tax=Colwellia sp. TT2012 TaxID=1720342 RepID=UPI000709F8FD|nr:hypothetical protein [Colwellia sp. TT2012]